MARADSGLFVTRHNALLIQYVTLAFAGSFIRRVRSPDAPTIYDVCAMRKQMIRERLRLFAVCHGERRVIFYAVPPPQGLSPRICRRVDGDTRENATVRITLRPI